MPFEEHENAITQSCYQNSETGMFVCMPFEAHENAVIMLSYHIQLLPTLWVCNVCMQAIYST